MTIVYKNFKKTPLKMGSRIFTKFEDIQNCIKGEKIRVIYQVLFNTITKKYCLRYSDVKLNILDYWISKFMFGKLYF